MNENPLNSDSCSEDNLADFDGEPPEPSLRVMIANEQSTLAIDEAQLEAAVRNVFHDSEYSSGIVSIAVVDDPTIHEINRQYLEHDYPTDVLSFVLEDRSPHLEGELVVSTDTATSNAKEYGWPAHSELTLYVIHGALHLVGYRDKEPDDELEMREAETSHLLKLSLERPTESQATFRNHSDDEVRPS